MGRVYAVVSAKGGVGKTTTAANVAAALAAGGSSVAVVDGDLGMANLANVLGVSADDATLHDVLAGSADVSEAIVEGPHGMAVAPGSADLDAFARADPEALAPALDALAERYDHVVVDTGAGLSNDTVVPLTAVDEVLLVSTPTRDALSDTEKSRQVAERLGVAVAGAALTRADEASADSRIVTELLDAEVLASIPDADEVRAASEAGEPLTTFAPGSEAAVAFRSLASKLTGTDLGGDVAEDATETDADARATAAETQTTAAETQTTASDAQPDRESDSRENRAADSGDAPAPDAEPPGGEPVDSGESRANATATPTDSATETGDATENDDDEDDGDVDDDTDDEDIVVAGSHEEDLPSEVVAPPDDPPTDGDETAGTESAPETTLGAGASPDVGDATPDDVSETTPDDVGETTPDDVGDATPDDELDTDEGGVAGDPDETDADEPLVEPADAAEITSTDEAPIDSADESGVYTTSLTDDGEPEPEPTTRESGAVDIDDVEAAPGIADARDDSGDDVAGSDDGESDGDGGGGGDDDSESDDEGVEVDAIGPEGVETGVLDSEDDENPENDEDDAEESDDGGGGKGLFGRFFG